MSFLSGIPIIGDIADWATGEGAQKANAKTQAEIDKRQAVLDSLTQQIYDQSKATADKEGSLWNSLGGTLFSPSGLLSSNFYSGLQSAEKQGLQGLLGGLGNYNSQLSLASDPSMYGYVGDVAAPQYVGDAQAALKAILYPGDAQSYVKDDTAGEVAQNELLDQLKSLTNPQETAVERLLRENARREYEGQIEGSRKATAQELKSRGVYGSGAELTAALQANQDAANRRALENQAATAGAVQRAMQAINQRSQLGTAMVGQELEKSQQRSATDRFNKQLNLSTQELEQSQLGRMDAMSRANLAARLQTQGLQLNAGIANQQTRQGTVNNRSSALLNANAADNTSQLQRLLAGYQANTGVLNSQRTDATTQAAARAGFAQNQSNSNLRQNALLQSALQGQVGTLAGKIAGLEGSKEDTGLFGGLI